MRRYKERVPDVQAIIDAREALPAGLPTDRVQRQHRREGFAVGNADNIFDSTYSHQTQKRGA